MKIDFDKEDSKDSLLAYLLTECVAKDKLFEKTYNQRDAKGKLKIDAKFIVNGVEMPVSETFEKIHKQMEKDFDQQVLNKANELLQEKAWEVTSKLNKLNRMIDKLFPAEGDDD